MAKLLEADHVEHGRLLHRQADLLEQMQRTQHLMLDHLGIEVLATTDHRLPVVKISGHTTRIDGMTCW
jgi:hypothetical protein